MPTTDLRDVLSAEELAVYMQPGRYSAAQRQAVEAKVERHFQKAYGDKPHEMSGRIRTIEQAMLEDKIVKKAAALGYKNVLNDPQQLAAAMRESGNWHVIEYAQALHQCQSHPAYLDPKHPQHDEAVDKALKYQEYLQEERERFLGERA